MSPAAKYRLSSAGVALAALTLSSVFFIDLCDLIYQCGCDHLWAAQAAHCNIHTPGAKHCPWCSVGELGYGIIFGVIAGAQALAAFFPRRWPLWKRALSAVAAFPLVGGVEGLVLGLITGYWY